MKLRYKEK